MRRVRSTNTAPEKRVRSLLHKLGFRFRLHRNDLPGKPDIVLPKHHVAVFVHGCFWHRHQGCPHATTPASRQEYWLPKFKRTIERDRKNQSELRQQGWNVAVVWECAIKDASNLASDLVRIIGHGESLVCHPQPASMALVADKLEDYRAGKKPEENAS